MNAFKDYHIGFHGTKAVHVRTILDSGTLLLPGVCCWLDILRVGVVHVRVCRTLFAYASKYSFVGVVCMLSLT